MICLKCGCPTMKESFRYCRECWMEKAKKDGPGDHESADLNGAPDPNGPY